MGLLSRRRYERAGFALYTSAVQAARTPWFYARLGVADTVDGRFDMIGLHAWLVIRRVRGLPGAGPGLAQAVFDAMFADMDVNLREIGVGDLSVGKKVKAMWEALHGRASAYDAGLDAGPEALAEALARNVWRGAAPEGQAAILAQVVIAAHEALGRQEDAALLAGKVSFPPLDPVA